MNQNRVDGVHYPYMRKGLSTVKSRIPPLMTKILGLDPLISNPEVPQTFEARFLETTPHPETVAQVCT